MDENKFMDRIDRMPELEANLAGYSLEELMQMADVSPFRDDIYRFQQVLLESDSELFKDISELDALRMAMSHVLTPTYSNQGIPIIEGSTVNQLKVKSGYKSGIQAVPYLGM